VREALVTYISRRFDMRNTIPAGTWYFKSQIGTYNFLYPASEKSRLQNDLEVISIPAWPKMAGLAAYQTPEGIVWCEPESVRRA
jgi:hypothetical protein